MPKKTIAKKPVKQPQKKAPTTKKTAPKSTKKKDKTPLSRSERLAILKQSINTNFKGRATIKSADEFSNVFILRRPTGITSLDMSIGGGFPAGGLSQIIGSSSVGKDYLVNLIIANLQTTYGEDASVCLAMTEMHFDKKYAKKCGVRIALTALEISQWQQALERDFTPEEMAWATDQVGTVNEIIASNAEELLEATAQCIESNLYQIIVINSFGALLTKAEEETDITQKHYGGAAMPITNFMKRVHSALNSEDAHGQPNTTTIIGINQFRDNLGSDAKWNPLKIAGGNALKHGKLVDVYLKAQARIKYPTDSKIILGKEIHWEILKGKAGCHDGPKGMYPFYFGEYGYPFGADVYQDVIVCGVLHNILQMNGAWILWDRSGGQLKGQGKEKFAHVIADAGLFNQLRDLCFEAAGVNFITKSADD